MKLDMWSTDLAGGQEFSAKKGDLQGKFLTRTCVLTELVTYEWGNQNHATCSQTTYILFYKLYLYLLHLTEAIPYSVELIEYSLLVWGSSLVGWHVTSSFQTLSVLKSTIKTRVRSHKVLVIIFMLAL